MQYKIQGDGSYLALINPQAYKTFVGRDWAQNPKLLEPHFIEQMQNYSGLFWDTNLEADWIVDVMMQPTSESGFREVTGSIKVTNGQLVLFEYNALTMMAQFETNTTEKYIKNNTISLENGDYNVKIIQKNNPDEHFPDGTSVDFIIEIIAAETLQTPWQEVPWSKL